MKYSRGESKKEFEPSAHRSKLVELGAWFLLH
uniref:Uncharacterized protein n=1 Tax=Rhizophora mucronata TaxID=61149 RepID=A0A2P2Q2J9_RHIMU